MVPVGIVGLSPAWESRYRPALRALGERIAVRAIYDPVSSRAEQAATEWNADLVMGMRALARREDLKAILVLDRGWSGTAALELLCASSRPLFVGGALAADGPALARLRALAEASGVTIMPELGQRYTATTIRLRELMATELGRPWRVEIEADTPAVPPGGQPLGRLPWNEFVSRVADWCCAIVATTPMDIEAHQPSEQGPATVRLRFLEPRSGGPIPEVTLRLRAAHPTPAEPGQSPRYRVECLRGRAEILSEQRIVWEGADTSGDECLASERSETEVMLDHFCRRVVGGLVPVADLEDVHRGWTLAQAAAESLRRAQPIQLTLNGKPPGG